MEIFKDGFKVTDYDIIGFDLDNTLARYRIGTAANFEYLVMAKFLVEKKYYPTRHLYKSFEEGTDFLMKGLFLDIDKGNILKLDADARIIKGYHGMHPLSQDQIVETYGSKCHWRVSDMYVKDPLSCWNGVLSSLIRALLDYFDISVSLIFSRLVTTIDEINAEDGYPTHNRPQMWRDICESLNYMFNFEHFALNRGEYFPKLKKFPDTYYYPCNKQVIEWIRDLRQQKKLTVLISGSDKDFVSHTARNTLGEKWTELFDLVVCYAKKPGFFTGEKHPFLIRDFSSQIICDTGEVPVSSLIKGGIYGKGHWEGVMTFARRETGIAEPRALYFGDHMIQDIFAPNIRAKIDVVAIVEELAGVDHPDKELITSSVWGNYMGGGDPSEPPSLWASWLQKHACLAVPSMEAMAAFPIDHVFKNEKGAGEAVHLADA